MSGNVARALTEKIKTVCRERPTAINGYGLRSWHAIENDIAAALREAGERADLVEALRDAVAHLAGAASAYRRFAKRHSSQGKAETDALFSTRVVDFDNAAERGRAVLMKVK